MSSIASPETETPSYRPPLIATRESSLEGIDFVGVPGNFRTSVSFALSLVDTVIFWYPRWRLKEAPRHHKADDIDLLRHLPGNPTVWVGFPSEDHDYPQFPPTTPEFVVKMGMYNDFCDFAAVIAKSVLDALLGETWTVLRIEVQALRKHIYLEHFRNFELPGVDNDSEPPFEDCGSSSHTVLAIFHVEDGHPNDTQLAPRYILDLTIMEYGEPNAKRFGTWEDYRSFVGTNQAGDSWIQIPQEIEVGAEEELYLDSIWDCALKKVCFWVDAGRLNISTVENLEIEAALMNEMSQELASIATRLAHDEECLVKNKELLLEDHSSEIFDAAQNEG